MKTDKTLCIFKRAINPLLALGFICLFVALMDTQGQEAVADRDALNKAFGVELWADDNLWDDQDAAAAQRLKLKEESRTNTLSGFRAYPESNAVVLSSRPYSISLNAENGNPTEIMIVFINKGDYKDVCRFIDNLERAEQTKDHKRVRELESEITSILKEFPAALEAEAKKTEDTLKAVLGQAAKGKFGQTPDMRERVLRWDWNGHAILLSVQEEEYLAVRIVPVAFADAGGVPAKISDMDLKKILKERVKRRENGDVVVADIPMVDQGPKGFCVPATWERYLRYLGIPADMYVLAMAGNTQMGGGTSLDAIANGVERYIKRQGRSLDRGRTSLDAKNLAKYIDDGLPIMWAMYVDPLLDSAITDRTQSRKQATDWKEWNDSLKDIRKKAKKEIKITKDHEGHVCMIIGYNAQTEELATTDSWGPEYTERWWTIQEAEAISQGNLFIIKW